MRRFAVVMLLGMVLCTAASADEEAPAFGLVDVMNRLALNGPEATRSYRQIERSTLLTERVVTSGRITMRRDGTIQQRWRTSEGAYRLSVHGSRVQLRTPEKTRSFDLADAPRLEALVAALRAFIEGSAGALRRRFDVSFSGRAEDWRIVLAPRASGEAPSGSGAVAGKGRRIEVAGAERIQRIHMRGDGRDTTILIDGGR